jgi:hypothetical protein
MDQTILCLSWLNGQFKAMSVHRGTVSKKWEAPQPAEELTDFPALLNDAVEKTGYSGTNVALVLAHPRLTHQLVETPPAKGWLLERFLTRRVTQLKTFESEAVYSYEPTPATKGANGLILHLFPKPLLDQLVDACNDAGLHLMKVIPTTVALMEGLKELALDSDDVGLLAAETFGTTAVVIGQKNGPMYLARSVNNTWSQNVNRVVVDMHRTILFVEQQFGVTVKGVWLTGSGAEQNLAMVQSLVKVPVNVSSVAADPFFWLKQAGEIPASNTNNLVSIQLQKAPLRRKLLRVTALLIALLLLVSMATAAFVQKEVSARRLQINQQRGQATTLMEKKGSWQQRYDMVAEQKEFLRAATAQRIPPVPLWWLGYIGDALPEELLLTRLQTRQLDEGWSVQLAGTLQPTTNKPATVLSKAMVKLTNNLVTGPFAFKVTRAASDERNNRNTFVVEGVVQ